MGDGGESPKGGSEDHRAKTGVRFHRSSRMQLEFYFSRSLRKCYSIKHGFIESISEIQGTIEVF